MDRRIKILYLLMAGSKVGGAEEQYRLLIEALDKGKFEPVAVLPEEGELREMLRRAGAETFTVKTPMWRKGRSIIARYIAAHKLVKLAEGLGIDLAHSEFRMTPYLIALKRKLGIPIVSHVRTDIRPDQIEKYKLAEADAVIAISCRLKRRLLEGGIPPEKVRVVYDGVDLGLFSPEAGGVLREEFRPRGEVLIGLVGRIEPFKRQLDFLRAAEMVIKSGRSASFFLIGAVQSKRYFREIERFIEERGLEGDVILTGGRRDMPRVMASLDVLVTLSGGSVMLEAMACGKPVVSATSLKPEESRIVLHGETGLLVPRDEIEKLAEAICKLVDDPDLRRRMGEAGRRRAEELFGRERMARETEAIYEELIRRR